MGDDSWKSMPKIMSIDILTKVVDRIVEHSNKHDFNNISISLHGGEPLLVGLEKFEEYINVLKIMKDNEFKILHKKQNYEMVGNVSKFSNTFNYIFVR